MSEVSPFADHAIVAEGISKQFRISSTRTSIKNRLFDRAERRSQHRDFWALQPLDLIVPQGSTVGLLGHNGSGKSTLLKCIAGILKPTTGSVMVRGRVASLLELGAGFHPDLTGRENVFINASFLGVPRREVERRFDEIVAFAGIEEFIDQQVKYYSSGMYVRLGFAVAVNVDPDILLIDEVLAVGDEAFQRKCIDRIEDFQRAGKTIVFVTHAAEHARRICERCLVLHHGEVVADAEPGEAIRVFREHLHGTMVGEDPDAGQRPTGTGQVELGPLVFEHGSASTRRYLHAGDALSVHIPYHAHERIADAQLSFEVRDDRGDTLYAVTSDQLGTRLSDLDGDGELVIELQSVPLLDGAYPVSVELRTHHDGVVLALRENLDSFEVMNTGGEIGRVLLPARLRQVTSVPPAASVR